MKKLLVSVFVFALISSSTAVFALDFSNEITVYDKKSQGGSGGWWNGKHGNSDVKEDQEIEPGMQEGQAWDLEGMFLNDGFLSLVGGYDFKNGYSKRYGGDIFLDVDGNMQYGTPAAGLSGLRGNGYKKEKNVFGYDYVIDMTFDWKKMADTYKVYKIDNTATLKSPYYRENDTSGAWRYVRGGKLVGEGTVQYQTGLTDAETGFEGGFHNAVTVDLDFLDPGTEFTAHYTMGCGNDDLIGKGTIAAVPTPEPGTLLLLGFGLLGLIGIAKKQMV